MEELSQICRQRFYFEDCQIEVEETVFLVKI